MADCAVSAGSTGASSGKFDTGSAQIDLLAFPVGDYHREFDAASIALNEAKTLLKACFDITTEASDKKGFFYRPEGWAEARFDHLHSMLSLVWDRLLTAQEHSDQGDNMFAKSIDRVRA